MPCDHSNLLLRPSQHASAVDYRRPTGPQRLAAATNSGAMKEVKMKSDIIDTIFPGPLILPGDDLANDVRSPKQSLRSWSGSKDRNRVTSTRNTMYVAAPPDIHDSVSFVHTWTQPNIQAGGSSGITSPPPMIADVMDYLRAFYTGFSVKRLSSPCLRFENWDPPLPRKQASGSQQKIPRYIGLNIGTELVGIRTRPSPDEAFPAQLNLDDLLEAAITALPGDAYCLLLIVNQDIFEDEEDVFVCGRAYGGSRVAIISTARYNPALDFIKNIEREHAWPASHCQDYIASCIAEADSTSRPKKRLKVERASGSDDESNSGSSEPSTWPMDAALEAYKAAPAPSTRSPSTLLGLWLGRVCRTASHELGHCFGIEHCVYYACVMQSSSTLSEDARQPPFLCPIDLIKVLRGSGEKAGPREHYRALLSFCERYPDAQMFVAFAGWLRAHLALLSS